LLESIPRIRATKLAELPVIPGRVPDLASLPPGCRFADRCPYAGERCTAGPVELRHAGDGRAARCVRVEEAS
jgi:oligopeptide/dipeptide ABC transporter ATP-binding protein